MKNLEHQEQVALMRWAEYQARNRPELALLFSIPNGGLRNKVTAAKLKASGVKPGVPDLCLPVARGDHIGLWIEMKAGRNRPTPSQVAWHMRLSQEGHRVVVCWSWEAAKDAIEEYLRG